MEPNDNPLYGKHKIRKPRPPVITRIASEAHAYQLVRRELKRKEPFWGSVIEDVRPGMWVIFRSDYDGFRRYMGVCGDHVVEAIINGIYGDRCVFTCPRPEFAK